MKNLVVILDRAHGSNTPGKQSPDKKHKEWVWSQHLIDVLSQMLIERDFEVRFTVTDQYEPGLTVRQKRADAFPGNKKILLSIHNNAAGMGDKWVDVDGFAEIYTCKGQTKSDGAAWQIYKCIKEMMPEIKWRVDMSDGDIDKEENFTVLMGKSYMGILLEWGFQDDKGDIDIIDNENNISRLCMAITQAMEILNQTL